MLELAILSIEELHVLCYFHLFMSDSFPSPCPSTIHPIISSPTLNMSSLSLQPQPATKPPVHFYALVNYEDTYVQPLLLSALATLYPPTTYTLIPSLSSLPTPTSPLLLITQYESIPFTHFASHPTSSLMNSYIIRKALIRKHYLSTTCYNWSRKHPASILATNVKPSCEFELDYAEFMDDVLVEAWELQESWLRGEGKEKEEREWWILKPGMSDRGQGIRLFSSEDELREIFEGWEEEYPETDSDSEGSTINDETKEGTGVVTSHLRHFIAQPYIHAPLLLDGEGSRKFHIRTYVLCYGALEIYVYRDMLALFAATPYTAPWNSSSSDLSSHLTNTCLQTSSSSSTNPSASNTNVQPFFALPQLSEESKTHIFTQIKSLTAEVFEAAAKGMMVHFQPLPNAFEVFGVDFLVDEREEVWLLEVNAFPDFGQSGGGGDGTGNEEGGCRWVVEGFWRAILGRVVGAFFGVETERKEEEGKLVCVRKVDLGRR